MKITTTLFVHLRRAEKYLIPDLGNDAAVKELKIKLSELKMT